MHIKGIVVYLVVSIGVTCLAGPALAYAGLIVFENPNLLNNLLFIALLWTPALGALVASLAAPSRDYPRPRLWPIPAGPAVRIALVVFGAFVVTHVIIAYAGWTRPQWGMSALMTRINAMMFQPLSGPVAAVAPMVALIGGALLSIVLGATLFALAALGNELGWRGYLLPRLMPLGRPAAYALVGVFWLVWVLPLLYLAFSGIERTQDFWSILPRFAVMLLLLSVVLGEIQRRSGHVGLAAVGLGSFFAQAYEGVWQYLFPIPVEPWTGSFGVVAIAVWAALALFPVIIAGRAEGEAPETVPET